MDTDTMKGPYRLSFFYFAMLKPETNNLCEKPIIAEKKLGLVLKGKSMLQIKFETLEIKTSTPQSDDNKEPEPQWVGVD